MGAIAEHNVRRSRKRLKPLGLTAVLSLSLCSASAPSPDLLTSAPPAAELVPLENVINRVGAPALAAIIRSSRDQALRDGARPIPLKKQKLFRRVFDADLLEDVRWTVSSARPGIDTLLAGSLEYDGAVTLDNVIIFFNEAGTRDPQLWLHELEHVRQYREKGVEDFAGAYLRHWQQIEQRTHDRSVAMLKQLKKQRRSRPFPRPAGRGPNLPTDRRS